jgi:3-phenylpropionate/cinnamic acid dioxygenase small subunit
MGAVAPSFTTEPLGFPRLPMETRLPYGGPEYNEVMTLMNDEAEFLDGYRFEEWLQMLSPDIEYRIPVRLDRLPKDGTGFVYEMEFMSDDMSSLQTRIKRLGTKQAWAEQPVSRTRHLITNVRVHRGSSDAELEALSSFMVTRQRWDLPYDLFTGERHDTLRRESGVLRLARRVVYFDQTELLSHNLSIVI